MKITQPTAGQFPQSGISGPAGGDLSGNLPGPTVSGIQGVPVSSTAPTNGQELVYNSTTGTWEPTDEGPSGLASITDGTTTITPVTALTVAAHSLSGATPNATLAYITPTYGGQETLSTVAASGAAQTLNPSAANDFDVTLTANCTFTLGTTTTGKGCAISVVLRQDGTGSRTVTWPGSVTWITGTAPVLKTAAAAIDVITLFTFDGGTTWGGAAVGAISGTTSPLTTKGDVYTYSTVNARIAVGTNGQSLTAASVQTTGLTWMTHEVLMVDGITSPPEPVTNEAGTDWLYEG